MYAFVNNAGKDEVEGYYYRFSNGSITMYKGIATRLNNRWNYPRFKTEEGDSFKISRDPGVVYRSSLWLDYKDIESVKHMFRADLEKRIVSKEQKLRKLNKEVELLSRVDSVIGINTNGINSNK